MQPRPFPNEAPVDVRRLLADRGADGLAELMRLRAGYVPQPRPLTDFVEAVSCGRPLLAMGEPGCGKTAFGKALRYALNVTFYYLQCHYDLKTEETLYYWINPDGSRSRENLGLCDLLAAYDHCMRGDEVPVLVVDEIDKTKLGTEYQMLEVFETRQATIPNLQPVSLVGIPDGVNNLGPVVIITANEERELSEPMISRCIFTYFLTPTPAEEVAILKTRVPLVSEQLLRQFVKMIHVIRGLGGVTRKPGIRESLSFLNSLVRKGIETIDWDVINAHLGHIAKTPGDVANIVVKEKVLANSVHIPHAEIDEHVALAFAASSPLVEGYVEV